MDHNTNKIIALLKFRLLKRCFVFVCLCSRLFCFVFPCLSAWLHCFSHSKTVALVLPLCVNSRHSLLIDGPMLGLDCGCHGCHHGPRIIRQSGVWGFWGTRVGWLAGWRATRFYISAALRNVKFSWAEPTPC